VTYALQTLLHERSRYAAGVGAVLFSAVLIALQVGLLLGLFELTSIPVDHSSADLWVGGKQVQSVDLGRPIPVSTIGRLNVPGLQTPELYYLNFANFTKPGGGNSLCTVLGAGLSAQDSGCPDVLTAEQRQLLTETMTVAVDASDLGTLGLSAVGDRGKVNGKEVRLVAVVHGIRSLAAPWMLCSQTTARELLIPTNPDFRDHCTYLLARCNDPTRAKEIAARLNADYPEMSVYTADEFSTKSRLYWLLRTKAGVALGYAALLGLLVGAVITAQTLYAATMASAKEFATLLALGIPRRKIYGMVMTQSFWVGLIGVALAYPLVHLLAWLAESAGGRVVIRWEVLLGAAVLTMLTSLLAGVVALRSVRTIEPMSLLR
jgi:putative ABC transport system permease protein